MTTAQCSALHCPALVYCTALHNLQHSSALHSTQQCTTQHCTTVPASWTSHTLDPSNQREVWTVGKFALQLRCTAERAKGGDKDRRQTNKDYWGVEGVQEEWEGEEEEAAALTGGGPALSGAAFQHKCIATVLVLVLNSVECVE